MAHPDTCQLANLTYFADPDLLRERALQLQLEVSINDLSENSFSPQALNVQPVKLGAEVTAGKPDTRNAAYVLATLEAALAAWRDGHIAGVVTGPVNKAIINESGVPFSGHTEWFAEQTGTPRVVMMLTAGDLRVALVTTHLPLVEVPAAINKSMLTETLEIIWQDLKVRFGIENPRVMVCGLNPHAGEGGHLGREEIEIIEPVLDGLRSRGMQLSGPVPADTAFTPRALEGFDAVVAMYHDQGLPVLKHAGFGEAVNITLGLPLLRTSVDHGTAFDLAGTGKADTGSLISAIQCAADLGLRTGAGEIA